MDGLGICQTLSWIVRRVRVTRPESSSQKFSGLPFCWDNYPTTVKEPSSLHPMKEVKSGLASINIGVPPANKSSTEVSAGEQGNEDASN